jgi:hypothetical protein
MLDTRALGLAVMRDPSKQQTMRRQLCTLVVKREKKEKTADDQIWPPKSVSRASLMARASPTHWTFGTCANNFSIKKLKIQCEKY